VVSALLGSLDVYLHVAHPTTIAIELFGDRSGIHAQPVEVKVTLDTAPRLIVDRVQLRAPRRSPPDG